MLSSEAIAHGSNKGNIVIIVNVIWLYNWSLKPLQRGDRLYRRQNHTSKVDPLTERETYL